MVWHNGCHIHSAYGLGLVMGLVLCLPEAAEAQGVAMHMVVLLAARRLLGLARVLYLGMLEVAKVG